jgi:hypothetical protein
MPADEHLILLAQSCGREGPRHASAMELWHGFIIKSVLEQSGSGGRLACETRCAEKRKPHRR